MAEIISKKLGKFSNGAQVNPKNRFYIHTLGCKVNQYESQAMREILLREGFEESLSKEATDIYIINTCTVTHHADKESRYFAGMFHRTNPNAKIVIAGCYAERNADEISALPGVTHIVKNADKASIADILGETRSPKPVTRETDCLSITDFKDRTKAFVKIQDGCENHCSYCKVPLVRGGLRSKPLDKVIEEIKVLLSHGFKELVFTGICLGAWGKDISPLGNLVDVLRAIEKIKGDFRIRLSSIEPKYVTDELIKFISESKKICRHLHIPLQSGDDEILKSMNRPYTTGDYRALTEKLKNAIPDIAISTDIMVGFPGETEKHFRNTLNFVKAISLARIHIFTFSKRDGVAASDMPGEVSEGVSKKWYLALKAAALEASYVYRSRFIGKNVKVLVEAKRDKKSGLLTGYSDNYIKVLFAGDDALMKRIVSVEVKP